jgi:hypothetical protein
MSGLTLVGRLGDGLHHGLGDVLGQLVNLGLGTLLLGTLGLELGNVLGRLSHSRSRVVDRNSLVGSNKGDKRDKGKVLEQHGE